MKLLILGDPHGKIPKNFDSIIKKNKIEVILCTGDLGNGDLARKFYLGKTNEEVAKLRDNAKLEKKIWTEINNSAINVVKKLSQKTRVYSLLGNVGTQTDAQIKREEKKLRIKLPHLRREIEKQKNFHLVQNQIRNINGLKIGFLDYFTDDSWIKEFGEKDKEKITHAKKGTQKSKRILNWFGKNKIDILVTHIPPYKILDKVNFPGAPKHWQGKHAGSKVVLEYIKKYQPKYVFCGHIHEAKGKAKIGKTTIINAGYNGDCEVIEI